MSEGFDLAQVIEELRRRRQGPSASDIDEWQSLLADPFARVALRALAGDTVDRMAEMLTAESELVSVVARAIGQFSGRGWAASFAMPVDVYRRALQLHDQGGSWEEVEALLEAGWAESVSLDRLAARVGILGAADDDLREIAQHRARLIEKAWAHHANGSYEASIPIVLAQIDGITHDATTSPQETKGRSFFSLHGRRKAEVVDDETLAGINEALPIVRKWFSTVLRRRQPANGGTTRRRLANQRRRQLVRRLPLVVVTSTSARGAVRGHSRDRSLCPDIW